MNHAVFGEKEMLKDSMVVRTQVLDLKMELKTLYDWMTTTRSFSFSNLPEFMYLLYVFLFFFY